MKKINFFTVDLEYIDFLKKAETDIRGFSRVPNMEYRPENKPKFVCGPVLCVNGVNYYVPVSSYNKKQPDNFVVRAANGQTAGTLRFNYMFPVPDEALTLRSIQDEPDRAYKTLLAQQLRYCIKYKNIIRKFAIRTYERVLLGQDPKLMVNSCNFLLLEEACKTFEKALPDERPLSSLEELINAARELGNDSHPCCNERCIWNASDRASEYCF